MQVMLGGVHGCRFKLQLTLSMVKECMDPVTCMLPVMLPILPETACPVFVLRFMLLFSLVGALSPPGRVTC